VHPFPANIKLSLNAVLKAKDLTVVPLDFSLSTMLIVITLDQAITPLTNHLHSTNLYPRKVLVDSHQRLIGSQEGLKGRLDQDRITLSYSPLVKTSIEQALPGTSINQ
jgi:hypothetical protein